MKISTILDYAKGFASAVDELGQLEEVGLDHVWVPEVYTFDSATAMGFIAARTRTLTIGSGIFPIYTRTPSLLAMTAAGLDELSEGRAMLGIGASGPQVIEGFHGVSFDAPVARTSEIIDICRQIWAREPLEHRGEHYEMPRPGGPGKALKIINHLRRDRIPIVVAALGPKSVEMTARKADGWLPVFFTPENASAVWGESLAVGLAEREADLDPLDVFAGGLVAIGDGMEDVRNHMRPMTALYVGGMGAPGKNFYNTLFAKSGYEEAAREIQDLYLSGQKERAEAAVPDSFLGEANLCGPEGHVRDRIEAFREAGVTTLNVNFAGRTAEERVGQCARLASIVKG